MVLESKNSFPSSIEFRKVSEDISIDDLKLGERVYSLLGNRLEKEGTIGLSPLPLPSRYSSGSIGARLREINGLLTIIQVDSAGPAEKTRLQLDDQILKINDADMSSAQKINRELSRYMPRDTIKMEWVRKADMLHRVVSFISTGPS